MRLQEISEVDVICVFQFPSQDELDRFPDFRCLELFLKIVIPC